MKKGLYKWIFTVAAWLVCCNSIGQVAISGPACILPGVKYTYNITGSWDSASTMQVCITGGVFTTIDSLAASCTLQNGPPLGAVEVAWSDTAAVHSLAITSSNGNSSFSVSATTALSPGQIDTSLKMQSIPYDSLPAVISCSLVSGGSCNPSYIIQWQQSFDELSWVDIPNSNGQNLLLDSGLTQATYYRRKVTEQSSGTIAYSDIAFVDVQVQVRAFLDLFAPDQSDDTGIAFRNMRNPQKTFK